MAKTYELCRCADLKIDRSYQRELNIQRAKK